MSSLGDLRQSSRSVEHHVAARIGSLFERYPHLIGFFLQDPVGFQDVLNPSPIDGALCILDLAFSIPMSDAEHEKVRELIRTTVQQILSDQPEAFKLMRERAFARAVH